MEEKVRDFMVPVKKFPMIPDSATFAGAILALEKAQEDFLAGRRETKILLVYDQDKKVVGKLSPIDVVRGLEPNYEKLIDESTHSYVRNFDYVIKAMREKAILWSKPLDDLCAKAKDVRVKDFLRRPSASQIVQADDTLNLAFHHFVIAKHDSLFVLEQQKLVGMLRFSDVYKEIIRRMKDVCRI